MFIVLDVKVVLRVAEAVVEVDLQVQLRSHVVRHLNVHLSFVVIPLLDRRTYPKSCYWHWKRRIVIQTVHLIVHSLRLRRWLRRRLLRRRRHLLPSLITSPSPRVKVKSQEGKNYHPPLHPLMPSLPVT